MAPKSEASLLAEEMHGAGATREEALERLKEDFPSMQRARRSQLIGQYWKKDKDASEPTMTRRETMAESLASTTAKKLRPCSHT